MGAPSEERGIYCLHQPAVMKNNCHAAQREMAETRWWETDREMRYKEEAESLVMCTPTAKVLGEFGLMCELCAVQV